MNPTALGITFGLLSGLSLSLGGPIVRFISENTDSWQFLTWRSWSFAVFMFAIAVWRAGTLRGLGRETARIGPLLLPIAAVVGFGQICYVLGLIHTKVADVAFIIGTAPIFTAFVAWLVLGERLKTGGIIALVTALTGVAIMLQDGLGHGVLLGQMFAIGAMLTYSAYVIMLRFARNIDTFVASGFGGLVATAVAAWLCGGQLSIPYPDLALAIASGTVQVGFGFAFVTLASRYIAAAQVTLLALIETVLGPVWVWLLINETPALATLIGGAIIIASVIAFALMALADERRSRRARRNPLSSPGRGLGRGG